MAVGTTALVGYKALGFLAVIGRRKLKIVFRVRREFDSCRCKQTEEEGTKVPRAGNPLHNNRGCRFLEEPKDAPSVGLGASGTSTYSRSLGTTRVQPVAIMFWNLERILADL